MSKNAEKRGGLDGIVEQAPEREEGSACRAEPDEIEPCEDVLEDVAPRARALHDAAAKVCVECLEAVAHAMEVAHKPREEREDLAGALERGISVQHLHLAPAHGLKLTADAALLLDETMLAAFDVRVSVFFKSVERGDHELQAGFRRLRAGPAHAGHEPHGVGRGRGERIDLLVAAVGQRAFEKPLGEPLRRVFTGRRRHVDARCAKLLETAVDARVKFGRTHPVVRLVEVLGQDGDDGGRIGCRQKLPEGRCAQTLEAGV